jgi:hypothetical protein
MFLLFAGAIFAAKIVFGISLILMIVSLGLSLVELQMSVGALDILLRELQIPRP